MWRDNMTPKSAGKNKNLFGEDDSRFDWKEHWKEMPGATYGMNYGSRKNGSWNRENRRALGTIEGI